MPLLETILEMYQHSEKSISTTYSQLIRSGHDMGFTSNPKNERDYHEITRRIVVSVMNFKENGVSNLLFSPKKQFRVDLMDDEIIPYYSDYIELRYIIKGRLVVLVEGQQIVFNENEICFIDSMAYHQEIIEESECYLVNINIQKAAFTESFLKQIELNPLQKFLRTNVMQRNNHEHFLHFVPSEVNILSIEEWIMVILEEMRFFNAGCYDISKGYLIRIMDLLAREQSASENSNMSVLYRRKLFDSINLYIMENLSTVSITDLTEMFFFHQNFFNILVKEYTGSTFSQYLIDLRISQAKSLLETTQLNIEEIMWNVGYHNKGFFYRKFKEQVGCTPFKYRKQLDKG